MKYVLTALLSILAASCASTGHSKASTSQYPLPDKTMATMQTGDALMTDQVMRTVAGGQEANWSNPGTGFTYSLKVVRTTSLNPLCKEYEFASFVSGQMIQQENGITCLNNDGTWSHSGK